MKTKKLENFIFVGIYSLLVVSALGAMSGTYAWFEYQTRVNSRFYGTALSKIGGLKVGLVSSVDLPDAERHGLTQDTTDSRIYWSSRGLSSNTLSYFLSASGYASNKLRPITSGSYVENGNFSPKRNPVFLTSNINTPAQHYQYAYIPLVFSVENSTNYSVRLTKAEIESSNNLEDAIRVHFKSNKSNFLLAPHALEDGYDVVGGTLDLNKDGYIDYDSQNREFLYGEADNVSYSTTPNEGDEVLERKDRHSFNGVHAPDTYSLNDDVVYKTSEYKGLNSVMNYLEIADSNVAGYAYLDLTIYAEGWSSAIIDQNEGSLFNLDLTFALYSK